MSERRAPDWIDHLLGWGLRALWLCLILAAITLAACQVLLWLRDGAWTEVQIRAPLQAMGLPEPAFAWVGLQRIVSWVLDQELLFGLLGGALLLGWIGDAD